MENTRPPATETPTGRPGHQAAAGEMVAEPVVCGNEEHLRPAKAVWRITWPNGPYNPNTACVGCGKRMLQDARDEEHDISFEAVRRG